MQNKPQEPTHGRETELGTLAASLSSRMLADALRRRTRYPEPSICSSFRLPLSLKAKLDLASRLHGIDRTQIVMAALEALLPAMLAMVEEESLKTPLEGRNQGTGDEVGPKPVLLQGRTTPRE